MTGHKKIVDDVLKKGRVASSSLRKEKNDLEEKLLSRLLELQKALEEVSTLSERIDYAQSEILSLRKQVDMGCSEKLALERELQTVRSKL